MTRSKRKHATQLATAETEQLIAEYNEFVEEWNRRERDLNGPLPCSSQAWSQLHTVGSMRRHRLIFQRKREPRNVRYEFDTDRSFEVLYKGSSCCRNSIHMEQIMAAWRVPV